MPKQIQLSGSTLKKIAEALFLAYTQEQAAYLGGISERTLARILKTDLWREIERQSLEMERPYRRKIYRGEPGWQGAAWMLERKYASQLSKPEVQLSLNTGASVTNNTLVITAEQAQGLKLRNVALDEQLQKLSPPSARAVIPDVIPAAQVPVNQASLQNKQFDGEVSLEESLPNNNELASKTLSSSVVLAGEGAAPTGTPDAGGRGVNPILPPKSKNLKSYTTKKKSVGIDSNSKLVPQDFRRGPGRHGKVRAHAFEKPQPLESLGPVQSLDKKPRGRPKRGMKDDFLPPAPGGPKSGRK